MTEGQVIDGRTLGASSDCLMLFAKPIENTRNANRFVTNGTIDAAGFRLRVSDLDEAGPGIIGAWAAGPEAFLIADSISDEMIDFRQRRELPGPALYPSYQPEVSGFPTLANSETHKARHFFVEPNGFIAGKSGKIFTDEIRFGNRTRRRDYGLRGENLMAGGANFEGMKFDINYLVNENRPQSTSTSAFSGKTFSDIDGQNGAGIRNFGYYVEFYTNETIRGPLSGPFVNQGPQTGEMRHLMSTFYGRSDNLTLKNIGEMIKGNGLEDASNPVTLSQMIATKPLTQGVPIKFGGTTVTCGTAFTSFHLKRGLTEPAHYLFFPSEFANVDFISAGVARKVPRIVTGAQSVVDNIHNDIMLFLRAGTVKPIR